MTLSLFAPTSSAVFSPCGRYRYRLSRELGVGRGRLLVVGVNPSKADGTTDDPTVRVLCGYGMRLGFAGLDIGNLFGLVSTDPKGLRRVVDPIGPENDDHLLRLARGADLVIAAWGPPGALLDRDRAVIALLAGASVRLHCLAMTKDGHPRHPLRMRLPDRPIPFEVPRGA